MSSRSSHVEIRWESPRCLRNFRRRSNEQSDFSLARHRRRWNVFVSRRFEATIRDGSLAAFSQHGQQVVHRQCLDQPSFVEQREQFWQRDFCSARSTDVESFAPPGSSQWFPAFGIFRRRYHRLNNCPNQSLDARKNRFVSLFLHRLFFQLAFVYNSAFQRQLIYINGILSKYGEARGPLPWHFGSCEHRYGCRGSSKQLLGRIFGSNDISILCKRVILFELRIARSLFLSIWSASEVLRDATLTVSYAFEQNLLDQGSLANDGSGTNVLFNSPGRVSSYAANFSVAPSYVKTKYLVPISSPNQSFTFALWINPRVIAQSSTLIQLSTERSDVPWSIPLLGFASSGRVRALLCSSTAAAFIDSPSISANVWTHVAVTYNALANLALWINGMMRNSSSSTFNYYSDVGSPIAATIGGSSSSSQTCGQEILPMGQYFGLIDQLEIYSRVLSADEILALANTWETDTFDVLFCRVVMKTKLGARTKLIRCDCSNIFERHKEGECRSLESNAHLSLMFFDHLTTTKETFQTWVIRVGYRHADWVIEFPFNKETRRSSVWTKSNVRTDLLDTRLSRTVADVIGLTRCFVRQSLTWQQDIKLNNKNSFLIHLIFRSLDLIARQWHVYWVYQRPSSARVLFWNPPKMKSSIFSRTDQHWQLRHVDVADRFGVNVETFGNDWTHFPSSLFCDRSMMREVEHLFVKCTQLFFWSRSCSHT